MPIGKLLSVVRKNRPAGYVDQHHEIINDTSDDNLNMGGDADVRIGAHTIGFSTGFIDDVRL